LPFLTQSILKVYSYLFFHLPKYSPFDLLTFNTLTNDHLRYMTIGFKALSFVCLFVFVKKSYSNSFIFFSICKNELSTKIPAVARKRPLCFKRNVYIVFIFLTILGRGYQNQLLTFFYVVPFAYRHFDDSLMATDCIWVSRHAPFRSALFLFNPGYKPLWNIKRSKKRIFQQPH